MTAMVLALAIGLAGVSAGCSEAGCGNERYTKSYWLGQTVTLKPEDGPFSTDQLMRVAYQYHPMTEGLGLQTGEEYHNHKVGTPQWRALDAAHEQGLTQHGPWRALVKRVAAAYPGHFIMDTTTSRFVEPSYGLELGATPQVFPDHDDSVPERQRRPLPTTRRVLAMVSFLAPIYFIYEVYENPDDDDWRHPTLLHTPMSPEVAPMAAFVEREILALYPGYHRISEAVGMTIVPHIAPGHSWYGEATLIDALFNTNWD